MPKRKKKKKEARSAGLSPDEVAARDFPPEMEDLQNPYLRNFVVARIRPFRTRTKATPDADALLDHMEEAAAKFDVGQIRADQIARTASGGE